ncbi:MAG: hypothetical protein GY864_00025 [Desulfobacterales bacterium]|nr:hypothetical protein [Desulfobacterales bacterium]
MKLFKIVMGIAVILVVIVVLFVLKTFKDAGQFKTIEPHCSCKCTPVDVIAGPEDITIDPETKMAFVSSDDRRAAMRGDKIQGAIYAYSLDPSSAFLINLTTDLPFEFHPHGITLYHSEEGKKYLSVINHRDNDHFIEVFEFKDMKLNHLESIRGPLMTSPNDILAVGPRQYYVTNDHGASSPLGRKMEDYLQLPNSYVLYYDGSGFRKAAGDIAYANGIAISKDGSTVYVASILGRAIKVFARDRKTETLTYRQDIDLGTGADNIEIDEAGNLWVGCHPKMLTFVKHSGDASVFAPSQIIKISSSNSGSYQIKEFYLNIGEEISASSVAAVYQDRMLIGAVFDDHFLDCTFSK